MLTPDHKTVAGGEIRWGRSSCKGQRQHLLMPHPLLRVCRGYSGNISRVERRGVGRGRRGGDRGGGVGRSGSLLMWGVEGSRARQSIAIDQGVC